MLEAPSINIAKFLFPLVITDDLTNCYDSGCSYSQNHEITVLNLLAEPAQISDFP